MPAYLLLKPGVHGPRAQGSTGLELCHGRRNARPRLQAAAALQIALHRAVLLTRTVLGGLAGGYINLNLGRTWPDSGIKSRANLYTFIVVN